ncbi:uncharacterized protein LOC129590167 isoform X2 [Paramacrobiotus metropolitanus]|uniref:uncharacterized protein LOC129590167 isoform X2 n=1 Tax=Paramacrobiotus metropolitanus TaxID=2943436 RepID=UPI002445BEB7|nr:uncharacterized protein LOC129590167 isoform X2 [Paramacrobiotus metropolitanus]
MDNSSSTVSVYGIIGGCFLCVILMGGMLFLCVGFKRKQKKGFGLHEPVRLLFKHDRSLYSEPTVSQGSSNGHINPETAHRLGVRTHSPTWRNSSLSRELPAIPDGNVARALGQLTSYESASNLYACLDDVRVGHDDDHGNSIRSPTDPQSSGSSAETGFQAPNGQRRIHPYDRIGAPSVQATVPSVAQAPPVTGNARSVPSTHNHAQILQQMDNDAAMADYRGEARSDMSYTSITVRAPLSNLRTRRSVEDGYSNVPGSESHLYAQVGGEYGGSVASGELGSHIYNELYAEIDGRIGGLPMSSSPPMIDPYATSAGRHPPPDDEPVPSTSRGPDADVDKLSGAPADGGGEWATAAEGVSAAGHRPL